LGVLGFFGLLGGVLGFFALAAAKPRSEEKARRKALLAAGVVHVKGGLGFFGFIGRGFGVF
jgi:hypothetical protein